MHSTCSDRQSRKAQSITRVSVNQLLLQSSEKLFASPLTFVLLVWGLMFIGLALVLRYA